MRTAWEEAEIAIEEARLAILVNRWDNDHDYDDHNHDDHDLEQKEINSFFAGRSWSKCASGDWKKEQEQLKRR